MAMPAALILRRMHGSSAGRVLGGAAAELLMVAGYFGYASLLLGKGLAAAASIPGNLVQGAAGLAAGLMLMAVMVRSQLTKKLV